MVNMSYISLFYDMFATKPAYVEQDIPDLSGKVCIVTGSNTGLGKQVAQALFHKNAIVWVAVRNEEHGRDAIKSIREASPKGSVRVVWVSSSSAENMTVKGGIDMDNLDYKKGVLYVYK
ncbi:hypothetical protein F5Y11DRAFT_310023 [Daldinia sp. FL1419]|nr:hypothetical protein F5Y11DRAFT_310023 [Daldinia sp. FL1419]